MTHYFTDVPRLGNVAVSRHAQAKCEAEGISEEMFRKALFEPDGHDIPEGSNLLYRDRGIVRLVIIPKPEPFCGARLVKTVIRLKPQAAAY